MTNDKAGMATSDQTIRVKDACTATAGKTWRARDQVRLVGVQLRDAGESSHEATWVSSHGQRWREEAGMVALDRARMAWFDRRAHDETRCELAGNARETRLGWSWSVRARQIRQGRVTQVWLDAIWRRWTDRRGEILTTNGRLNKTRQVSHGED